MIKAVVIGFAHMHVNEVALYIHECPDMELIGLSDVKSGVEEVAPYRYTRLWNLQNVKENYCDCVYEDYTQMLDELKPDIAFILTENCMKSTVVEECAKRGINICLEKPMAVSLEDAKKIQETVHKYGIEAVVNWPVAWRSFLYKMKALLDQEIVGKPLKMRYINGHTGPLGKGARHRGVSATAEEMTDEVREKTWWYQDKFGGGVFLDICCYGCYFTKWFMGDGAKSVFAHGANLNSPFCDAEDNFAAIVDFGNKMSVIEGTWTTPRGCIPSGAQVMCENGVVMCTGGALDDVQDVKVYDISGNEIEVPELAEEEKFKNMPCHYAHHIKTGEPIYDMLTLDKNVEVIAILDAVIKSSRNRREEIIRE